MSVKPEFMMDVRGKKVALYVGLVDLAHQQGLKRIGTTIVQIPNPENGNTAICMAEVETERGMFCGIGDASPANVSKAMVTCLLRMAETRAKARALRDATNAAVVSAEEMDPNGEAEDESAPAPRPAEVRSGPPSAWKGNGHAAGPAPAAASPPAGAEMATPAQRGMIESLCRKANQSPPDFGRLTRPDASTLITHLKNATTGAT